MIPSSQQLSIADLSVRFGKRTILDGIQATFSSQAIGLLGPNGSGKTTLIHTLLGFHPPFSGSATVLGVPLEAGKTIRQWIGYMPERESFIAHLTGIESVKYMAELSGLPPKEALEKAHEALYFVGLGEARYRKLEEYSLGMKQLIKLAQAIVHGPKILFLDEPTNGLDPPGRMKMLQLICEIRDSGKVTVLFSSHLLRDVETVCQEVLILKQGRVVRQIDLKQEQQENRRFLEIHFSCDHPEHLSTWLRYLREDCGGIFSKPEKNKLKLILADEGHAQAALAKAPLVGVSLRKIHFKKTSLEDLFLEAMEA